MLGKIIGAVAGRQVARQIGGMGGTSGALLGVGAAALLRRMGPGGLIAAGLGSYALKRHFERQGARKETAKRSPVA